MKKLYAMIIFLALFPVYLTTIGQVYKVDYKNLPQELLPGTTPTICILEDNSSSEKLFDKLSDFGDIKRKYNCYSTQNIIDNKDLLKVNEFNAENKNFLNALNEQLSIEYVLDWKDVPDSNGVYQLTVYSAKDGTKLYTKRFYNSVNSNPALDVNKLLIQNLEAIYLPVLGELDVAADPDETHFKLLRDNKVVKEWTGNAKQKVDLGKYQLIARLDRYIDDEKEIDITEEKPVSVQEELKPDPALFPEVYSSDERIKNIKVKPGTDDIKITFDLAGEKDDKYNMKLLLMDPQTKTATELKEIAGDIKEIQPKPYNNIAWQFRKELPKDTVLKKYNIQMQIEEKGGIPWYYYAGGAVVGAGSAVLLLGKKGDGGGPTDGGGRTAIQPPPVRP